MVKIWDLAAIQFPKGFAALIAGYSDNGIRVCAAIQSASAFLRGSFFQDRSQRQPSASLGREASAAFIYF